MAFSAHDDPEQVRERFESADEVYRKAGLLAERIKKAKHVIFFTGAGISTSAGVPDFRGPQGVWTLRAQGKKVTGKATSTLTAIPTVAHMSLVELQNRSILSYLVSQNCDGLHRRSGIAPDRISELHGNNNKEYCVKCGKEYLRGESFGYSRLPPTLPPKLTSCRFPSRGDVPH
jgi:NAD-dependent SIR2 family protein deacetylase